MADSLKKMLDTIPRVYNPEFNPVINAFITAIAQEDDLISTQIDNGKDQIFIRTATGQYLNKAANSLGVSRPPALGLDDPNFQELVPNLSLKPKQIKKAFYDTADVFWGPLFSRANATTANFAPYDVLTGDVLSVIVDNGPVQNIKALTGDIAINGAATAEEIVNVLSRVKGATASVVANSVSGTEQVNLRTNTPGSVGTVEFLTSSMVGPSKLDFMIHSYDILDLPQRVSVYNLTSHELVIEIPAIVPALRRTLKGSHHFHADGTLEPPEPTSNGIWQGSFFFDPTGSQGAFTLTSQKATLEQTLDRGSVYTSMTVDSSALVANPSGIFMLNFGFQNQEGPIRYRGVPNSNTILIDPSYVFKNTHLSGESFNVLANQIPYTPRRNGQDLAIYLTSPSSARTIVQGILDSLKAAGIIIHFIVLAPKYRYVLDNPYLPEIEPSL
jgi:hypothetical protein